MSNEVKKIMESIKNPMTGKTLFEENRFVELNFAENQLMFTYNREGIGPGEKRQIEDSILVALKGVVDEKAIQVKTVSSNNSQDVFQKENAKPANLKVGHANGLPQKKRVKGVGKVIGISSGKGGVGKSTVAVNLALSLKQEGHHVGLIDADIYGPSVPMLLGQRSAKPVSPDGKRIGPIEAYGIKFISFGLFVDEMEAVIWRGPMLGGVLNQFLFDVEWGELDYLVVDLPPGTGDIQLSLAQLVEIDGIVTVSTPQNIALLDSKKGLKMFEKLGIPLVGMVENMAYFVPDDAPGKKYFIFGEGGVVRACTDLGVTYLGGIPLEIAMREGSDLGKPYMADKHNEGRPAYLAYIDLAKSVDKFFNKNKSGLLSKIFGRD